MAEREWTEAEMHAACLSIAEGATGWKDVTNHSPAIAAVKKLRTDYEAALQQIDGLRSRLGLKTGSSPAK